MILCSVFSYLTSQQHLTLLTTSYFLKHSSSPPGHHTPYTSTLMLLLFKIAFKSCCSFRFLDFLTLQCFTLDFLLILCTLFLGISSICQRFPGLYFQPKLQTCIYNCFLLSMDVSKLPQIPMLKIKLIGTSRVPGCKSF